jgi:outer membrane protein assembly factor BamB
LAIAVMLASCAATAPRQARASSTVPAARQLPVSVRLGGEVDGLAAGGGYLWAYLRDTGVVMRVDPRNGQARRFRFAPWRGMPVAAAVGPGGLWLANQHATRPDVIRIDPRTGRVDARPQLPDAPGPVTGLAVGYGSVWILIPDAASPPGWRVLRLNPATDRVDGSSAAIPDTQLTGHTAAIWASSGQIWVTGSMHVIVRLDPRTLALQTAATAYLSEGLVFGGGRAWALSAGRPRLAVVDPRTGKVIRSLATPPPSATGDDYLAAGPGLLWVFRGPRLCQLNPATGRIIASARVDLIAPAFYSPAVIAGQNLWFLAQTSHGTALDRIAPAR